MQRPVHNLDQLEENSRSDKPEVRGSAIQALLLWARKDPSIQPKALEIFKRALTTPRDSWAAINAARGVELIEGPAATRGIWLSLLQNADNSLAASVAMAITDPGLARPLIDLLRRNSNVHFRTSAIRTLGRLLDSAALFALVEYLKQPELRPHAVEALGELGDSRAIAHLEPLLQDKTDAWPVDNHGPMLRVCDLAEEAIKRLRGN